jgi:hypothetical protein
MSCSSGRAWSMLRLLVGMAVSRPEVRFERVAEVIAFTVRGGGQAN